MKISKFILFISLSAAILIASGCTQEKISDIISETAQPETVAKTMAYPLIDSSIWEDVYIDDEDDQVGFLGELQLEYCPLVVTARVDEWTEEGFTATVLSEFDENWNWLFYYKLYYRLKEIQKYISVGNRINVAFSDNTIIRLEEYPKTTYTHRKPDDRVLELGTMVQFFVNQIDQDNHLYSDYLLFGPDIDEESVEFSQQENAWIVEEAQAENRPTNIDALPYVTVKIDQWKVFDNYSENKYRGQFRGTVLDCSVDFDFTNGTTSVFDFYELIYDSADGRHCFDSPNEADFPAGTVVKLYYADITNEEIVKIERVSN